MKKYNLDKNKIKLHNIVYAITSKPDYEMERILLLEDLEDLEYGEYVVVEGCHCSCYGFDDTKWDAMKYTREELIKLAEENIDKRTWYGMEEKLYNYILRMFK